MYFHEINHKCYFCRKISWYHDIDCVVNNRESADNYKAGFKSGSPKDPAESSPKDSAITSNHLYFTKGWLRAMVKVAETLKVEPPEE